MMRTVLESSTVRILLRMGGQRKKLFANLEEDIGHEALPLGFKGVDEALRVADGLDAEVAATQYRGDGELARIAVVAEAVLKAADRHVGDLADGVVDHFLARL